MKRSSDAETLAIRYLLGGLPEQKKVEFEEHYFGDDQLFESLCMAEDQLIEDYLKDRLSEEERLQFEASYLPHPRRRERVEFARRLLEVSREMIDDERVGTPPAERTVGGVQVRTSFWAFAGTFFGQQTPGTRLLLGGATAAVLGLVGWLVVQQLQLSDELAQERGRSQQLRVEVQQQRAANSQLTGELERERERLSPLERELEQLRRGSSLALSFVLMPGLQRSSGPAKRLVVPAGAESVRLQVEMETATTRYSRYQVFLRTVEGNEVWSGPGLPERGSTGRRVAVTLSPRLLARGDYILTLEGAVADMAFETIDRYFFSVVRKR